jgi:L-alanine-DL-glutamate epimerase-like enolase superfamily enzyme
MLDESIYSEADIDRAAEIDSIGYVKLKLKKLASIDRLKAALERIRGLGMQPVLGDGTSTELCCWMEACVARLTIDNAGEFNGFLKPKTRLFANPLEFDNGAVIIPAGFVPEIDRDVLAAHTVTSERFTSPKSAATARGAAE